MCPHSGPLFHTTDRRTVLLICAGLGGMDSPQSHDLRQFSGRHHPEKMDALRRTFCHVVSSLEVLSSSPHLLDLMDISANETSRGDHLLEGVGEVMGPLKVIVGAVCFEIHLPSSLDEVGVFPEGFPMVLLEDPCKEPPLFLPLVGMLFRSDV